MHGSMAWSHTCAITANTMKLIAPCARSFSSGVYVDSDSVVPPVNMKFQPIPSTANAMKKVQKCSWPIHSLYIRPDILGIQ